MAEEWESLERPGRGRGGVKHEYFPPPELLELIRRHMRGEVVTEEEVARARAAFPQAIGRMKRTRGASVANTNERHLAAATPATAGPAAELADGAASDTGWITDPTDADRLQMLLILLRTMEHRLKAPVSAEVAARILEAVDAWQDFAARQPDIRARLEAVRTAANLYLVR